MGVLHGFAGFFRMPERNKQRVIVGRTLMARHQIDGIAERFGFQGLEPLFEGKSSLLPLAKEGGCLEPERSMQSGCPLYGKEIR